MLSMAIILALFSTALEMFFVIQYPWIRRFMVKHEKLGLFFSIFLSFTLGIMFGVVGLTAFFAAIVSTMISAVIYKSRVLELWDKHQETFALVRVKIRNTLNATWKVIKFAFRVLIFPITAVLFCIGIYRQARTKINVLLHRAPVSASVPQA